MLSAWCTYRMTILRSSSLVRITILTIASVYKTSAEFYAARIKEDRGFGSSNQDLGQNFIRDCIFQTEPFIWSKKHEDNEKESFTLGLWDLDFQNILVNEEGEVTAIIDWEKVSTVPRCVGFSALPKFLQADWTSEYAVPDLAMLSPWKLDAYRKFYADALREACGTDAAAALHTEKSMIYAQIHAMLYGDRTVSFDKEIDVMNKLLLEIPRMRRINLLSFCETLWEEDWTEAKTRLRQGIAKVLDPREG
jgi:hypothetical protein